MELLNQALAGFAGWLGHGHGQRAALWAARLQLNQPEIALFRTLATPAASAYVAAAGVLEPPCGRPGPRRHRPQSLTPPQPWRVRAFIRTGISLPD
jgi:hypothetical protein